MTINPSEVWPLVAILAVGVGALWWLWNRIQSVKDDLSTYKLHVAETYVPNIAMRQMKDEIMGAVKELKTDLGRSLEHMGDRLDRMASDGSPVPARKRPPRTGE